MRAIFRYRANADESIATRHGRIMQGIWSIQKPWGLRSAKAPQAPEIGADLQVDVDLSPYMTDGLSGKLSYVFRDESYLRDEAHYDDLMTVSLQPEHVDYRFFAKYIFKEYVRVFTPYRASIVLDDGLYADDWEDAMDMIEENGKDVDGRDGVRIINPVNFFDEELCRRAFSLSPQTLESILRHQVEDVHILLGGILILVTSEIVDRETIESESARIHGEISRYND